MNIYIVYEIDIHNTKSSIVIKKLDTCKNKARKFFNEHKEEYKNSEDGYKLVLATYTTGREDIDSNIFQNIEELNNSDN